MMNENSMVVIENLTKEYKKDSTIPLIRRSTIKALDNLNLEIQKGEVFGYLGPNGAGKTTTFKLLLGLIFPTSGRAWIMGKGIREVDFKKHIGFLPEQPYFYDYLRGEEFLDFYAQLFQIPKKIRKERISKLMDMVGLGDSADKQLRKYSKGMLQRIGIAQALINDPEFLILDEPMSGLDPMGRKEVRDIILGLKAEGRTVIFSSHILSDVESICDRVGILIKGKLQFLESMDTLLNLEVESIEITVSGLNETAKSLIQSLGGNIIYDLNKTLISIPGFNSQGGEETVSKILKLIKEWDGKLTSITSQTQSLENLFLSLSKSRNGIEYTAGSEEIFVSNQNL